MARRHKAAKVAKGLPENMNSFMDTVASEQTKSDGLSSRKKANAIIRRSERLQNLAPPAQNQDIEPVMEEINLCENGKKDDPHIEENPPGTVPADRRLEEKINYLIQAVEELKSKATNSRFESNSPSTDLKYKSLYLDSQKKIEALTHENFELSKKLDVGLGKMKAYGEASSIGSEMLGKLKDIIVASNLAKAIETAMNLSSKAIFDSQSPDHNDEPNDAVELDAYAHKKKKRTRKNKEN